MDQIEQPARRRQYLTTPGEGMILSPDLNVFSERFNQFIEDADLGSDDLVSSPVVAFPIPQATRGTDGALLRWDGINPAMMWHPLFWLPAEVALRVQIRDTEHGEYRVESNDEWLLRVAVQVTAAGLFDVETGTWMDTLAHFGIDIEEPGMLERIDAWNAGGDDPDLDRVNLTWFFEGFSVHDDLAMSILTEAPDYVRAQWALSADFLGSWIREVRTAEHDEETLKYAATALTLTAAVGFPAADLIGEATIAKEVSDLFGASQSGADPNQVMDSLLEISARVFMKHQSFMRQIAEVTGGTAAEPTSTEAI